MLKAGETANCLAQRLGRGGMWCKTVTATPPKGSKAATLLISDVKTLTSRLGVIDDLEELQFVTIATSGNGWNKGSVIYKDSKGTFRTLSLLQNECTADFKVFEVNKFNFLKKEVGGYTDPKISVKCE